MRIADVAYTLQERRQHFTHRMAICASNVDELVASLTENNNPVQSSFEGNKIIFAFPGQGVQYAHMAKGLYESDLNFKHIVDDLINAANQYLNYDLHRVIYPGDETGTESIDDTQWTQISLFIIEYALARYLEHLGIQSHAFLGHSIGEYVAATLSGVFKPQDAMKLVIARGRLMQSMAAGAMLAIEGDEARMKSIIEKHHCEIALINSPEDIVASGTVNDIKELQDTLTQLSIPYIKINTSHAFHSKIMDKAVTEFAKSFGGIRLSRPTKPFISNVTGDFANEEVRTAGYWCRQLRSTVQFSKGMTTLSKQYGSNITFVEVGPGRSLSYFLNKFKGLLGHKSMQLVQLLPSDGRHKMGEDVRGGHFTSKEEFRSWLWMHGLLEKPNELRLVSHGKIPTGLPGYQFDFQKCWSERRKQKNQNDKLKLLSKEKWLSAPVWSSVRKLSKIPIVQSPIFSIALVFIRSEQIDKLHFSSVAKEIYLIVLGAEEIELNHVNADSKVYRVDPGSQLDFERLADRLKREGVKFDAIIHAASIDNVADIENSLLNSFYSIFLICQTLIKLPHLNNLLVLTNGLSQIKGDDFIHAANGTLVGAVRNINHEYRSVSANVIDVGENTQVSIGSLTEILRDPSVNKSVDLLACRFGKLWMGSYQPINNSPIPANETIEEGDVILITGGLGGIGLTIANYISARHKVKLILVSRNNIYTGEGQSRYESEKVAIIENIESNGSSVDIRCLDISNVGLVEELIKDVTRLYGQIDGIIHTAGVAPLSASHYDLANIRMAFKGKIFGLDNLINCVDPDHLKFLASTSSLASVMGDINRIEYCAANSYLDYLAIDMARFKNARVLSINWPGWSGVNEVRERPGVASRAVKGVEGIEELLMLNVVNRNEGSELFYSLMNQISYSQVVVSKLNIL